MAIRKASSYSKFKARPFTRISRNKSKSYIKTVPQQKIVKFHTGNRKDFQTGKHTHVVRMLSEQNIQVRDNALESARMLITKRLDEEIPGQYYLAVKAYPHHLLRENKAAGGTAGADRISTGMTQSFGIIIGRAALIRAGSDVFLISCSSEKAARISRDALQSARAKIPAATKIVFQKL